MIGILATGLETGTWSLPTRALDTIYQNTSGKKRRVIVGINTSAAAAQRVKFVVGSASPPGTQIGRVGTADALSGSLLFTMSFEVPDTWFYRATIEAGTPTLDSWSELDE